ncbi:MAG: methyltransferase domain-containing protein [Clostridia bacterium]|nr:methyltransferase domain-containing protein [Clostridia bacterium]MBR4979627.1 methyltransferase domain-containing protein [Clostridia bacterium]
MNVSEHYDKLIEEGNDPFYDGKELREYMDKWDGEDFIRFLELDKTKSVLEVGVGTGRLAKKAAPRCLEFVGIDISPKTAERARENLKDLGNVSIICADFTDYPFERRFDVIYSSLVMMHFRDKEGFISKISGLLEKNGVFCLSIDKNRDDFIDTGSRKLKIYPDSPEKTLLLIEKTDMAVTKRFDTEFAHVFVCRKP